MGINIDEEKDDNDDEDNDNVDLGDVETLESEQLEAVERDYIEEELCPCIFIPACAGVPLNSNPELVHEQEAQFHAEMLAKKGALLIKGAKAPSVKPKPAAPPPEVEPSSFTPEPER